MKKYILTTITMLFGLTSILLICIFFNTNKINENVKKSMENYNYFDSKKFNLDIDNYTDMIMLNIMSYNDNSIIKRSFDNKYGIMYIDKFGDKEVYWNQFENLISTLEKRNDDVILYGRFWHGYQIILKPLLMVFTYQQSLFFLSIIGIFLIVFSCFLLFKKTNFKILMVYLFSLLSLNIFVFNTCYQYYFSMILMIIFNIIILLNYKPQKFDYKFMFYVFGCLTAYFLFISFPLITLCFPLLLFMILEFSNNKFENYKENILKIIKCSIFWILGYVLFFSLKWIIGSLFGSENFLENALMAVNQRLGLTFSFKYIDILKLNLAYFFNFKFNIILVFISLIIIFIKMRKNFTIKLKIISPFLLIFLMPFIWMFICNNHSGVHYWMISRLFSISIFSLLFISYFLLSNKQYNEIEHLKIDDYLFLLITLMFFILYKFNFIFIILCLFIIFKYHKNKTLNIYITLLIILSTLLSINKFFDKRIFNDSLFYENIYKELYHKAIMYGEEYAKKNNILVDTKVELHDLIDIINSDSVFLLSCDGYIIVNNESVTPYINCNNKINIKNN